MCATRLTVRTGGAAFSFLGVHTTGHEAVGVVTFGVPRPVARTEPAASLSAASWQQVFHLRAVVEPAPGGVRRRGWGWGWGWGGLRR